MTERTDLHGVLTRRMLEEADATVSYLTYPHVDFRSTGERAARLLLQILDGGLRPVTARVTIPALVRGEELITETGAFGRLTRRAAALESDGGALAAGILISNPFTDVPELMTWSPLGPTISTGTHGMLASGLRVKASSTTPRAWSVSPTR